MTPETHAYRIPHVDLTNTQIRKSIVAADNASTKNDIPIVAEEGSISTVDRKCDDTNFSSYDLRKIPLDTRDEIYLDSQRKAENYSQQQMTIGNHETIIRALSNLGHVYEEVETVKEPRSSLYDIQDYYEKYSPATAKTLIDTLFLPRHAICRECAKTKNSSVYTDRLIYTKESLLAIEVVLCQYEDVSCFKYPRENSENIFHSQYDQRQDYMLVYSYTKTNVAGIFYSSYCPKDVFDLQSLLKPSIHVVNRICCNLVANTQLYHRCINNYHVRTSRAGCAPMIFYCDRTLISSTKGISCNNSQDPSIYQIHQSKNKHDDEHRRNRSSLLLLEPLLLMSESANSKYRENNKNRISRSEDTKIIRIITIYVLSFLILASITLYIVYFT